MKYAKIRILEYRDKGDERPWQSVAASARDEIAGISKRINKANARALDQNLPEEERGFAQDEVDALTMREREADARLAEATQQPTHARVGTFGYQEISDELVVQRVVDVDGQPFPPGAVMGYEVVEFDCPAPAWTGGKPKAA